MTIRLLAAPAQLSMAERDRFRLGVVATNDGTREVAPGLFALHLLVNGERSVAFDLAVGNGVVPAGWDVLEPGASTPVVEHALGEALFPEPGEFRLELVGGDDEARAEARTVVVTP